MPLNEYFNCSELLVNKKNEDGLFFKRYFTVSRLAALGPTVSDQMISV